MLDERITNLGTRADQHANHACRNAGFLEDARGQQAARHGGIARGLDHHGIPQGQCRCHRTLGEVEREVPWADHPHHTQRLSVNAIFLARDVGRQNAPVHPRRKRG